MRDERGVSVELSRGEMINTLMELGLEVIHPLAGKVRIESVHEHQGSVLWVGVKVNKDGTDGKDWSAKASDPQQRPAKFMCRYDIMAGKWHLYRISDQKYLNIYSTAYHAIAGGLQMCFDGEYVYVPGFKGEVFHRGAELELKY